MATSAPSSASGEGCPCVDASSVLSSLPDRRCFLSSSPSSAFDFDGGSPLVGVQLTVGGSCVPPTYGSSKCARHDLLHDPACRGSSSSSSSPSNSTLSALEEVASREAPDYCFRPWCYVDASSCGKRSDERVYRGSYFGFDSGVDLYYSYSKCNSSAEDWFAAEGSVVGGGEALGGIEVGAAIPTYLWPMMFKRDDESEEPLSSPGAEYFDDGRPFEGVYINYANRIVEISNGDIRNLTITHRSRASSIVHPASSFTAAVQDIQDGLIDMAIGPFWITGQRLKMAAFTIPVISDKTFLVIPRPDSSDDLSDQIQKVLAPFTYALWGMVIGIIAIVALLSVWFSDRSKAEALTSSQTRRRMMTQDQQNWRRKKSAYLRLALDSCLQKGTFFFSAGVEQDEGASLPNKLLLFGFGFFILITVSAYVANLAAFLTRSSTEGVKTIEGAVAAGFTICAHPALKAELQVAWPNANFYFHEAGKEFPGLLEDYKQGKCRVMAVGWEDTGSDTTFLKNICQQNLTYTDSLVVEVPIAFPIRPRLAAGFSYWIRQGELYHETTLERSKEDYKEDINGCDLHYSAADMESSEYEEITVKNMFFPLVFFAACAVVAVMLQIRHHYNLKKGRASLMGRRSTMDLVSDKSRRDARKASASFLKRRWSKHDSDSEEEEGGGNLRAGRRQLNGHSSRPRHVDARSLAEESEAQLRTAMNPDGDENCEEKVDEEYPDRRGSWMGSSMTGSSLARGIVQLGDSFTENGELKVRLDSFED